MEPESEDNLRLEIGHVLFIDLVGYSKLLIEEQKERLRKLTEIVLATSQVARSTNEQLVRLPTGDGMALVFHNSSEEPARCALEVAQALKAYPEVLVRMGVHSGPVSEVTDVSGRTNIAGAGINMAQRVMDCGDAGHILLSQRVADDLGQYRHWAPQLHDVGECEVKHGVRLHIENLYTNEIGNPALPEKFRRLQETQATPGTVPGSIGHPRVWITALVILLALLLAGAYLWLHRSVAKRLPSSPLPEKSIAVLPFENLSSDKENAYFADGIQDEILTRLAKIADLKVISRTSTEHYKTVPENLPEIARQLNVANILEGSVQRSGDAVRVNVQLIKAATDSHLWADTFDRKMTDIFSVESDIAKAIADQLRAKLTGQEKQVIAARPTDNPQAYDAYLRGLALTLKTAETPANALGAQKYLREAVQLDPQFALSWALLSYVEANGYNTLTLQPTLALREECRKAAATAFALQPNLGEAIMAKGYYHYACLKDYDTAVHYFEQARPYLPNSSEIAASLAYVARRRGQWERSESYFNQAEALDPRNVNLLTQHAFSYICLRRFPEALRKFGQILNITPDDPDTLMNEASIAQAEGDLPHAATLLAPLHPTPADTTILETQAYQAILERHPESITPRLREVLASPHPTLGYYNGELRFWLGWTQELAGDEAAAQESWRQARSELEPFLKEEPDNFSLLGDLALTNAALGDKAAAMTLTERAIALVPIERDALNAFQPIEILARVTARAGERDRAIASLQKLLSVPYSGPLASGVLLTPALLRLDPMFDPLRSDPRFQKLCEEKQP